jgi:hypothetical protein
MHNELRNAMSAWFRLWAIMAVGLVLGGPAAAEPQGAEPKAITALGAGLPSPGMSLEEARALPLASGQRLVCDSDGDKPRLADATLLRPSKGRGERVRLCTILVERGDSWQSAEVATAFGTARQWLTFVEFGPSGRYRLAQISLWGRLDDWDRAAALLQDRLGEPSTRAEHFLGWRDAQHEAMMFGDEKHPDEFAVAVADIRLRKLLKSPGAAFRE